MGEVADAEVTLEVCPGSNVSLGVYAGPVDVPLPALREAGVRVALGADDPLLFGTRLVAQYAIARHDLGLDDRELADLASASLRGSRAPEEVIRTALADIDDWLTGPPAAGGAPVPS